MGKPKSKNRSVALIESVLNERIKELECLYAVSKIFNEEQDGQLEDIFNKILKVLPKAYQKPENTCARIVFDKKEYKLFSGKKELYKQSSSIIIKNKKRGVIEAIYTKRWKDVNESPFLKEEQDLIETISRELANVIIKIEQRDENKEIESKLIHSDRLATLGTLAAGIAHELNDPLGSILGFSQLAIKSKNLPKEVEEDIKKIINSSLHAREIVRKLLFFSKQEKNKSVQININDLIKNGYFFLESRCAKESIEIVKVLDPNLPNINFDPIHVNQIIVNLFVNAMQAMPNGGKLLIRTILHNNKISLVIADTGIGMSEDVKKHIFEPFFTTKQEMGTGLGLAVVHSIVKSYKGSINVESELGKGSKFEVIIPVK